MYMLQSMFSKWIEIIIVYGWAKINLKVLRNIEEPIPGFVVKRVKSVLW